MTRGTKKYIMLSAVLLVCAVITGVFIRFSYQGSTTLDQLTGNNDVDKYTVQVISNDSEDGVFTNVSSYNELEKKSGLIAKVRITNERELYASAVRTKAVLEEIYKSDKQLSQNQEIYIYEPVYFEEKFDIFDSLDGYQLMKSGKEYYVFLNGLKTVKGYKQSEKEKVTFVPSTTKFSVFSTDNNKLKALDAQRLDGDGEQYIYQEIKDCNMLTSSKKEVETYHTVKKELEKKIKNKGF